MKPPPQEFEKVPTDNFINAEITNITYDEHHEFTVNGVKYPGFGIQFTFNIDGLAKPKKSRWYKFSYDERSNLYIKFIAPLVENAKPYMEFDLDKLKKMKVKMLWKDDKDPRFQSIETVRPYFKKISFTPPIKEERAEMVEDVQEPNNEEVPF